MGENGLWEANKETQEVAIPNIPHSKLDISGLGHVQ